MTDNSAFPTAFKLLTLGYSVIPSGGGDNGKAPMVHWTEFQHRQATEVELEKWQAELKPQLWGIVTGRISGVVLVDADSAAARAILENAHLAPHVLPPRGGAHCYFKHPGYPVKTIAGLLPGVDIRGDGGFCNVTGSSKFGEYKTVILPTPESLYPWEDMPAVISEAMRSGSKQARDTTNAPGPIKQGERNYRLFKLASGMRRQGVSEDTIFAAVERCYENDCEHEPPITGEELSRIAMSAARYAPGIRSRTRGELEQQAGEAQEHKPSSPNGGVGLVCMADVKAEAVSWLWRPYIPKGKLTLLEGDPGMGKSWDSLAIATAVTLGKGLPGQGLGEPASVLLASAEDGLGDTIRPRLDAMGADVSRIFAIDGALTLDENGFALLESYLERVRPALLIMDPLVAYLGASVDIFRPNETRAVMARLAKLAEKYCMAILLVRHLTKGGQLKAIYRGLGSIDFTAACRSVLLAGCDAENPQSRALVHIKSNLAPTGPSIGYELRAGGFYWTGDSDLTAARILAAEDTGDSKSARDEAADFLRDELRDGPVEAAQVWRNAREAGLSEITVKRAKAKLGIITRRCGEAGKKGGGKWTWELPDNHLEDQKDLGYQEAHIEKNDTLNNSSFKSDPLPKMHDTLNTREAVLGMSVEKALEIWCSQGAPVIHLGPGENCFDLERLLSNPGCPKRHLEAVRAWLNKERGKRL